MNQSRPPIADPDKLHEVITAYLDGELSGVDTLEVEDRLASDDQFRETVKSYQQTWEMLDDLPREAADDDFVDTTLELVTVRAEEDLKVQRDGWIGQLMRQWSVVGISVLAACVFGFLVTTGVAALLYSSGVMTDTNDALLADLPVIENIDRYQLAQDIDFLRALDELPRGVVEQDIPAGSLDLATLFNEPLEARRDRVEAMTASEKQGLEAKSARFEMLKPQQQQQLRDIHETLIADPKSEDLAAAMDRFYEWYKQLSRAQRDDLRLRSGLDRIAYVKQLRESETKRIARKRVTDDVKAVVRWMENYAVLHEDVLVPPRNVLSKIEAQRRKQLFVRLWHRWQFQPAPNNPKITDEAFAELRGKLSPELRAHLANAKNANAQWKRLTEILPSQVREVVVANGHARLPHDFNQQLPRAMSYLADGKTNRERMMKFFHELSREQKMRLQSLTPDEFRKKLQQLYFRHQMSQQPRADAVRGHDSPKVNRSRNPDEPINIPPRRHDGGLKPKRPADAK
jgi:hypothetical protein